MLLSVLTPLSNTVRDQDCDLNYDCTSMFNCTSSPCKPFSWKMILKLYRGFFWCNLKQRTSSRKITLLSCAVREKFPLDLQHIWQRL